MPIYRHHLQNRRLRVQVLVPLPKFTESRPEMDDFFVIYKQKFSHKQTSV